MEYDKGLGGRAWHLWPQLLILAYPHLEACSNGVDVLVSVAERALANFVNCCEDEMLQFVEFCAGKAQLSREMIRRGFHKGASLDILYRQNHDMMTAKGIRTWMDMLVSSRKNSLHWFGSFASLPHYATQATSSTEILPGIGWRRGTCSKRSPPLPCL